MAKAETAAQRIQALQDEAKKLARAQVLELTVRLADVETTAFEIAGGGDAYPPGVRDLARRLAEDCEARTQTIEAIMARA